MVDLPTMFKAVESVMVLICQVNVHRNKTLPSSRERKFFSSPDPIAFTGQERALGTRMPPIFAIFFSGGGAGEVGWRRVLGEDYYGSTVTTG